MVSGKAFNAKRWIGNKKLWGAIGALVTVVSLASVTWLAVRAIQSGISLEGIRWLPLSASFCLQVLTLLSLPLLWEKLLARLGRMNHVRPVSSTRLDLYKAYGRSWLARYIPGRIWMLGGRMVFAGRYGIPLETVARSMAFEMIFVYGVLTVVSVALIVGSKVHFAGGGLVFVGGLTAIIVLVSFSQRLPGWHRMMSHQNTWLRRFGKFVHRTMIGTSPLHLKNTVWGVTVYGMYACLQLVFIVLLAESITDLTAYQAVVMASAWGLGSVLGYMAFIAPGPGGLGIRDGITLFLFSQVIDVPTAALVVAISRLIMIVADAAFVGTIELVVMGKSITAWFHKFSVETQAG